MAVLVSGGVDSSVALRLAKERDAHPTAFYLKIWLEDELSYLGNCPWEEDLAYVKKVCDQLNIPLEVVSLQKEYWDRIVSHSIAEIKAGRTPNPDILCNQHIKFGAFFDKIDTRFDTVVTGHYAHTEVTDDGLVLLKTTPDLIKDQTYFLSRLSQDQLKRAWFPLGNYRKDQVRALARDFDLPTKDRKDSQGICFLGKLKFNEFVKHHLGEKAGNIVEVETGAILGTHNGFWFYTIGQRQGLGLAGGPWYVVAKDTADNVVFVSRNYYAADKKRDSFYVSGCNWIAGKAPEKKDLHVKMRHGAASYACTLEPAGNDLFNVQLATNDQGIASGQFAVFYDDDTCLGSGVITQESNRSLVNAIH